MGGQKEKKAADATCSNVKKEEGRLKRLSGFNAINLQGREKESLSLSCV